MMMSVAAIDIHQKTWSTWLSDGVTFTAEGIYHVNFTIGIQIQGIMMARRVYMHWIFYHSDKE